MIINFTFDYLLISFQIIGYALLLITIYCCYEAYFKIKRNKGYIYIAVICIIFLLPDVIKMISPMFVSHTVRVEPGTPHTSNTSISSLYEVKNTVLHLPFVELFLLLAVLKFSIKDEKGNPSEIGPDTPPEADKSQGSKS